MRSNILIKNILLIWPYGYDPIYVMPMALGYLASNVDRNMYNVKLLDCSLDKIKPDSPELKRIISEFSPDIVCTSAWSPMFYNAIDVLKTAKHINNDTVTILGGAHLSSYPQSITNRREVDFGILGEGEYTFRSLLTEIKKKTPNFSKIGGLIYRDASDKQTIEEISFSDDVDSIKIPDYDLMDLDRYIENGYRWNTPEKRNAPVWITRGCPYRCTFCSAPELNGKKIRKHSIEYIIHWIEHLYSEKNIKWINILDDNFTFHVEYAKEFCRKIIKIKSKGKLNGLGFGTPNGIRLQKGDKDLWKLMKGAGWKTLMVAPESGSPRVLELMKKDLDLTAVPRIIDDIKESGLRVQGFFILGYPGETPQDLEMTHDLIKSCNFDFVFLNNFQPLPGTPIYDHLVSTGEIEDGLLPKDYSDGERVYTPIDMSDFNFNKFVLRVYLLMFLRRPANIFYMLTIFSPLLLARKLLLNILSMFDIKKTIINDNHISDYNSSKQDSDILSKKHSVIPIENSDILIRKQRDMGGWKKKKKTIK